MVESSSQMQETFAVENRLNIPDWDLLVSVQVLMPGTLGPRHLDMLRPGEIETGPSNDRILDLQMSRNASRVTPQQSRRFSLGAVWIWIQCPLSITPIPVIADMPTQKHNASFYVTKLGLSIFLQVHGIHSIYQEIQIPLPYCVFTFFERLERGEQPFTSIQVQRPLQKSVRIIVQVEDQENIPPLNFFGYQQDIDQLLIMLPQLIERFKSWQIPSTSHFRRIGEVLPADQR